ncbi:MAG: methyltransferase domain-containing protein [Bacteroidota bacterium]
MSKESYSNKDIVYFINPRLDLVSMLPDNPKQKVLEIGMGGGDTLLHIKQNNLASEVTGIDIIELPGTNQTNPLIDKVHFIDLDKEALPFLPASFDVIIAGDTLEHLINPWSVLEKLSGVLKHGGHMLISLPNIRDMYALFPIVLKGNFEYTDKGIFDKTHMRFFCKKNMIKLVEHGGHLKIEKIIPIQNFGKANLKRKLFNKLTLKIFEEFTTTQYLIKAVKV